MFDFIKRMFSSEGKIKDPVCGMSVDAKTAKFKSTFKEIEYYFCSANCKTAFDQNPQEFN